MPFGPPPWYGDNYQPTSTCSSTVEEHTDRNDFRLIHRPSQQRSSQGPDSSETPKWFDERAPDKSDVGRSFSGVCLRSTAAKSDLEVRHQSRDNTVGPDKNRPIDQFANSIRCGACHCHTTACERRRRWETGCGLLLPLIMAASRVKHPTRCHPLIE